MRIAAGFVIVVVLFSGCAGTAVKPVGVGSSSAPIPTADGETGSITGVVVDDEARPIPNAQVGILSTTILAQTDARGAFTLNGLRPGSQSLFAQALGYAAAGRKVEVRAGEVTYSNFTLTPIAVESAPYVLAIPRTAFITVDQTWVTFVAYDLLGQNHSQVCGSCIFSLTFPKGMFGWMTENTYKQTGVPAYNDGVHLTVLAGGVFDNWEFCWREAHLWAKPTVEGANKTGKAQVAVQSSFAGLSFQHRVDMWNSFAYVAPFADNYTALPATTEARQDPSICVIK